MLLPLNRIIIFAGDVEKCANFFTQAFGFTQLPSIYPKSEWIELETGGCRLAFHQAHGPDGPIKSPTGSDWNPHKIVFYAQDVPAARTRLLAAGAPMEETHLSGDLALCNGRDPEGHVFQMSNRK